MLEEYRKQIDKIDDEIINLIEKRLDIVLKVGKYKKDNGIEVLDIKREKIILEKIKAKVKKEEYVENIIKIYVKIMEESKKKQKDII